MTGCKAVAAIARHRRAGDFMVVCQVENSVSCRVYGYLQNPNEQCFDHENTLTACTLILAFWQAPRCKPRPSCPSDLTVEVRRRRR